MPEISLFYGIRITMKFDEHNLPEINARYSENNATILIIDGVVHKGYLPNSQLKLVLAWVELHRAELMQNWELLRNGESPSKINPLT